MADNKIGIITSQTEGNAKGNPLKHDRFFRKSMECPEVAYEFFNSHLPMKIKKIVDLSTLKIESNSYFDDGLLNTIPDVVFSVKFKRKNGVQDGLLFLLVEHQSTPDRFMVFRLFKYMIYICNRYLILHPEAKTLPLVYPLVFYNGKRRYNVSKNLWDLFYDPDLVKEIWNNDHQLINIHDTPDEEFKNRAWSGALESILKHIFDKDLLTPLDDILVNFKEAIKTDKGYDYLNIILCYALPKIAETDRMKLQGMLARRLNTEAGEKFMKSLADHWLEEGKAEGKAEARKLMAREMLLEGYDVLSISRLTKLDEGSILALSPSPKTRTENTHQSKHR